MYYLREIGLPTTSRHSLLFYDVKHYTVKGSIHSCIYRNNTIIHCISITSAASTSASARTFINLKFACGIFHRTMLASHPARQQHRVHLSRSLPRPQMYRLQHS